MKEKIIKIVICLLLVITGYLLGCAYYNLPKVKYDTNRDGKITLADATRVINFYVQNDNK